MRKMMAWLGAVFSVTIMGHAGAAPVELDQVQPSYGQIEEDQAFILRFNQPVDAAAILAQSYCLSSALGERIPLRAVPEKQALELLTEHSYSYISDQADRYLVGQCAQRLAPGSTVQLRLFNTKHQDLVPRAFTEDQPGLSFDVRGPLRAQLYCDKTKSGADCNPLRPIRLTFSAPVQTEQVQQLQLKTPSGEALQMTLSDEAGDFVDEVTFAAPKTELAALQWQLPAQWAELKDDADRSLSNAELFQRPVKTAALPPLLSFSNRSFGVVERFADAPPNSEAGPALLPLAVRGVEPELLSPAQQQSAGQLRGLRVNTPRDMLQWYARLQRIGDYRIEEHELAAAWQLKKTVHHKRSEQVDPKTRSLFDFLNVGDQAQRLVLPAVPDSQEKDIELVGVPLTGAGLHVIEAQSDRLGATYSDQDSAMYVRTAALVTNLAVHTKLSADQMLVWVSRLDNAQPVANAAVEVLRCDGLTVASGQTDAQGRWQVAQPFDDDYCPSTGLSGFFIAASIDAQHPDAYGQKDSSFVLSSWDQGIESWRFQLPYFYESDQNNIAHTVLDRPLFLAGETAHLKHYWRGDSSAPLSQILPELVIRHAGSGDEIKQDLHWQKSPTGAWYALSTVDLADNVTLGRYEVVLRGEQHYFESGGFRVEAFKRPYLTGKLALISKKTSSSSVLLAGDEALLDLQLNYISGGVAAHQAVQVSALTQITNPSFSAYEDYGFTPDTDHTARPMTLIDKAPLTLDEQGSMQFGFALPASLQAQELVVETRFMDPNGQVQSLAQRQTIWPAEVVVGVNHPAWDEGQGVEIKGVTLSPTGDPMPNQAVRVTGERQQYFTTRQRLVGGFYRYDNHEKREPLGTLCETQSDAKGEWRCAISPKVSGQLILRSSTTDAKDKTYTTVSHLWLGGESTALTGENHDRMDVIADRKTAQPDDRVRFQVNMPFSKATALVAVEQNQVLHTQIVELSREAPFFDLDIDAAWGPNVYVSVLAVRGRLYDTTWRDFFSGGWKSPFQWYKQYSQGAATPSTMIDLAKPSFRYGIAQLKVANTAQQLSVTLQPEQTVYNVGQTARVQISATQADGTPAAHASLLLVGVDQALLELMPNDSWNLLEAMYPITGYAVRTATMQSEVIGRRHYGRKAVPAGGGGGSAPTREVLDSLLVWRTDVVLDAEGKASIEVPLNHSLTQFELVALVDSGGELFGKAHAQIQTHQPVQIMPGLPAEVRTGDQYDALFTLRNREKRAIELELKAQGFVGDDLAFDLPVQRQTVAAQSSATYRHPIQVPVQLGANQGVIRWELSAWDSQNQQLMDQLRFEQHWQALVPVRTQQVIWQQIQSNQSQSLHLSVPATALKVGEHYLGGVQLRLQQSLGGQQQIRDWFADYPYTCFEQQASKYIALHDVEQWQRLLQELPSYLDEKQLLRYFPSPYLSGSAGLNAYVLSLSAYQPTELALPEALAQQLLSGLMHYVEGRRDQPHTDAKQQVALYLTALDALARYDLIRPELFDSLSMAPASWPTSALIDGLHVLQHPVFKQNPSAVKELMQAIETTLGQRLTSRGSALFFADTAQNRMSGLMISPVTNQARLLLTVAELPHWQDRIPGLMHGLLSQQRLGRWGTTTENSWALLALERIDQNDPISGQVSVQREAQASQDIHWNVSASTKTSVSQSWPWEQNAPVTVNNQSDGALWVQLQAQAAVPVTEERAEGYRIQREVVPVQQAQAGQWQVGDVYRVNLTIEAEYAGNWTVINDATPAGASVLGSGLGRDAVLVPETTSGNRTEVTPSYIERLHSGYRAYIDYLPEGRSTLSYMVRLNTAGHFVLAPTEVESLYDASVQAQLPVEAITVHAAP